MFELFGGDILLHRGLRGLARAALIANRLSGGA